MTFLNNQGGPWERREDSKEGHGKQSSLMNGMQISWCISSDGTTLTC
jgi:hypothetical protein